MTRRARKRLDQLPRRERQIMDILFELGEGTAEDVRSRLPDPPSYSAARALLTRLERKEMVEHSERDLRYVYRPLVSLREARTSATERLVRTFYDGSLAAAASGLLERSVDRLDDEELDRLAGLIERARRARQADDERRGGGGGER
ncbi:MAG TPA: BlaI/MecI/CopY family transcriptional regulator [Thermoanaerobaculia bacterium]|nr:BlaI/MecI/CopY family transcriptional regulator [Thermoanaerobaculia bacterium]